MREGREEQGPPLRQITAGERKKTGGWQPPPQILFLAVPVLRKPSSRLRYLFKYADETGKAK